jgi:hypothetical protein
MNEQSNIVAAYNSHTDAEEAPRKLSAASFDIKKVSIIGKQLSDRGKGGWLLHRGRPHEVLGNDRSFLGRSSGTASRSGLLSVSGCRTVLVTGSGSAGGRIGVRSSCRRSLGAR